MSVRGPILNPGIRQRARELRHNATEAEQLLWECLRSRRLAGFKFRRQTPIGRYIVDFCCVEARLIVELDGGQHQDQQGYDAARDAWLRERGFTVLRVHNGAWMAEPGAVLGIIERACGPHPNPSPKG